MNNWYLHYQNETRRRQEEMKIAEDYRKAKLDPLAPPPVFIKIHNLLRALGTKMVQWSHSSLARHGKQIEPPAVPQAQD